MLMFKQAPKYAVRIYTINSLINNIDKMINHSGGTGIVYKPLLILLIIELISGIKAAIFAGVRKRCALYLELTQKPNFVHKVS